MFACIFFEEDVSLSVVNEGDKSLEIITTFLPNERIRMRWGRKIYSGIVIKVSENEEQLHKFASKANKQILDKHGKAENEELVQMLLQFEVKQCSVKRQRIETLRIKESKEQEDKLSPKKKKSEKHAKEKEQLEESQGTPVNRFLVEDIVSQFDPEVSAPLSISQTPCSPATIEKPDPVLSSVLPVAPVEKPGPVLSPVLPLVPVEKQGPVFSPVLPVEKQGLVFSPVPSVEKQGPVVSPVLSAEKQGPVFSPVLPVEKQGPVFSPVLSVEKQGPVFSPVLSVEKQGPVFSPVLSVEKQGLVFSPVLPVEKQDPVSSVASFEESDPVFSMKPVETPGSSHASCSLFSPTQAVKQQTREEALHSESLRLYREAVDTLEGNITLRQDSSQDVLKGLQVLTDPKFTSALQLLCNPTFLRFASNLAEHLRSDTNCTHPCLQDVTSHAQSDHMQGSFLEDLGTNSMSFSLEDLSDRTSTPYKPLYQEKNMSSADFDGEEQIQNNFERVQYSQDDKSGVENDKHRRISPRKHKSSAEYSDQKTPDQRRMSPRKHKSSVAENADKVKLLPNSNIYVKRIALRRACQAATKKKQNAGFVLMYNLLGEVFSRAEMADSRGTGKGRSRPGEESKPILDVEKIGLLKEYVNSWCKKNVGVTFPDKMLNFAVSERNAYARKQLKNQTESSKK